MTKITALFWDLGGVVLTNGWDVRTRKLAAETFGLDWEEFQHRHQALVDTLETGRLTLEKYLKLVVFYRERSFDMDEFIRFIKSQSNVMPETIALLKQLKNKRKYLIATLNNESKELNDFRIQEFKLKDYFEIFFNSGNLGVRKPDPAMFELALSVTQRPAEECIFIDDREFNLELARERSMNTILFKSPNQLKDELSVFGVTV